jgi:hypothetical protein
MLAWIRREDETSLIMGLPLSGALLPRFGGSRIASSIANKKIATDRCKPENKGDPYHPHDRVLLR